MPSCEQLADSKHMGSQSAGWAARRWLGSPPLRAHRWEWPLTVCVVCLKSHVSHSPVEGRTSAALSSRKCG
eukprot:1632631-Karenia_brevis.AAC.1